ncbi:class I SAM-dependent methyltransferase [Chitinophaga varians]|uniref:class I SAM-dependent methyltransferase n=1 Tax=Chitinophaga varians TaxID=2202339 RepID=UPI00165FFD1F|nr:class I SAM-dependent methyltransferase [Chitinophaga varians]MBC9914474.1 class I SAM-dependent methyltransferase [Chitinophaga varians]
MNSSELFNLHSLGSVETVDQLNKRFYGRYNFPWPPLLFPVYPPGIATAFVNQDIGAWKGGRLTEKAKIWVAGCGTNQAVFTALKFPHADVFATDISAQSIQVARKNAAQMGIKNLQLEEKSLNDIDYKEQFDYIICTGVVHHNAHPAATLAKISAALKKDGILELMVYNYYHRLLTTASQKAVRTFYDSGTAINQDLELRLIKSILHDFDYEGLMGDFLRSHLDMHEAEMADSLIQPIEYSYTIESFGNMADECNLEYLLHCQNQFDIQNHAYTWNLKFTDPLLKSQYYSLPDARRWQIANLLMCNASPMLWFYFQRKDATITRKTEQQVCDEFLETRFKKSAFLMNHYVLDPNDDKYKWKANPVKYPVANDGSDPLIDRILAAVNPSLTMREVLGQLGAKADFYEVNNIRIKLTTSAYPYLLAIR